MGEDRQTETASLLFTRESPPFYRRPSVRSFSWSFISSLFFFWQFNYQSGDLPLSLSLSFPRVKCLNWKEKEEEEEEEEEGGGRRRKERAVTQTQILPPLFPGRSAVVAASSPPSPSRFRSHKVYKAPLHLISPSFLPPLSCQKTSFFLPPRCCYSYAGQIKRGGKKRNGGDDGKKGSVGRTDGANRTLS